MRRGLLVIVSSPSGAGKTTLCQRLLNDFPPLMFSVSYTTRAPRAGEVEAVDYHFVDGERFERMAGSGELAEWAEVHGHRYGTTRTAVAEALEHGRDVLFDIDWQGGRQLKSQFEKDAVMIWILPPSLRVLEERLRRRATDTPDAIERRLATAKEELRHYGVYDFLVVNDDLDKAYHQVKSIYISAHLTTSRNHEFAERLLRELDNR